MGRPKRWGAVLLGACLTGVLAPGDAAAALELAPSPTSPLTTSVASSTDRSDTDAPVGGSALGRPGVVTHLPAGVPAPPALPAGGYLLADLNSGEVLVSANAHAKGLPASTIKVLTALALAPKLAKTTVVPAQVEDAAVDGTKVGLDPGASYTVEQLFQSLLMVSANDSAVALARAAGGMSTSTAQMNAIAANLGAHDTVAKNTSGLDADGQTTSAYDLALIGRAALANPQIARYVATKTVTFPGGRTKHGQQRTNFQIGSHNKLLWNYDGTLGVKNGYTVKARQTYIGAVHRGDRSYLLTYLDSADGRWRTTAAVFDWAFTYGDKAQPVGTLNVGAKSAGSPATTTPSATVIAQQQAAASASTDNGPGLPTLLVRSFAAAVGVLALAVVGLRIRAVRRMRRRTR